MPYILKSSYFRNVEDSVMQDYDNRLCMIGSVLYSDVYETILRTSVFLVHCTKSMMFFFLPKS
jgi:hypothetical protein